MNDLESDDTFQGNLFYFFSLNTKIENKYHIWNKISNVRQQYTPYLYLNCQVMKKLLGNSANNQQINEIIPLKFSIIFKIIKRTYLILFALTINIAKFKFRLEYQQQSKFSYPKNNNEEYQRLVNLQIVEDNLDDYINYDWKNSQFQLINIGDQNSIKKSIPIKQSTKQNKKQFQ